MNICFLDIDGVLNYTNFYRQRTNRDDLCPLAIDILNKFTNDNDCKLVISSTWRIGRTLEDLQKLLGDSGVTGEIIGMTPVFNWRGALRGNEIRQWIIDNHGLVSEKNSDDVRKYVILDDDSDMLYWQRNHFISVDVEIGLTEKNIFKAARILECKFD